MTQHAAQVIRAVVIAAIIGAASAIYANTGRLTTLETRFEYIQHALERIERKLDEVTP